MRLRAIASADKRPARKEPPSSARGASADENAFVSMPPLAKAPSQKELACVFGITTRHLRRLEDLESNLNHPCARPYTASDLWRLFRRRHPKRWNQTEAERLGLAALFTQFEQMLSPRVPTDPLDEQASIAVLMLRSIAWQDDAHPIGATMLPKPLGRNLAQSAREQMRAILQCSNARSILARAFFEAALIAEANPGEELVELTA